MYDDVPSNQVQLQKDQQLKKKRKSYFNYMILHCDLDLEDSEQMFLKDTLVHDDASSFQVW